MQKEVELLKQRIEVGRLWSTREPGYWEQIDKAVYSVSLFI